MYQVAALKTILAVWQLLVLGLFVAFASPETVKAARQRTA